MDSQLSEIERFIIFLRASIRREKKFYLPKKAILLDSIDLSKTVVSSRFKINDITYKFFADI